MQQYNNNFDIYNISNPVCCRANKACASNKVTLINNNNNSNDEYL